MRLIMFMADRTMANTEASYVSDLAYSFFFHTNPYMYLYAAVFKEEYEFVAKNFYNFSVFFCFYRDFLYSSYYQKHLTYS